MSKGQSRWLRRLGIPLLVILGLILAGSVYESVAEAQDASANPPPGELVDIGGYRLHINCTGAGSPTVVIEAGLGDWSTSWSWVQAEVEKSTRVCTYDRAGMGWSEVGPRPRTTQQFVTELHALLNQANVSGPYVLAGHSLGGFTARLFAHDFASETAGVVLIDATHPSDDPDLRPSDDGPTGPGFSPEAIIPALARVGFFRVLDPVVGTPRLPPDAERAYAAFSVRPRHFESFLDETRGIPAGSIQVREVTSLGDMPLIVLSQSLRDTPSDVTWQAKQTDLLGLSSRSEQLFADKSGHNIEFEQPEAATDAILKMVELVRGRQGASS